MPPPQNLLLRQRLREQLPRLVEQTGRHPRQQPTDIGRRHRRAAPIACLLLLQDLSDTAERPDPA